MPYYAAGSPFQRLFRRTTRNVRRAQITRLVRQIRKRGGPAWTRLQAIMIPRGRDISRWSRVRL